MKMLVNKGDWGSPHQRKFIINSKWWRKWCDYTGFQLIESQIEQQSAYKPKNQKKYLTDNTPFKENNMIINKFERLETDEVILKTVSIDEDTDLKLEMLRREMKMQRDLKSQITMFHAGKSNDDGGMQSEENQEYYREL